MKRTTATKRFTPEAIEQVVMDEALRMIAAGRPLQEAQTVMVAGFAISELLRSLAPAPLTASQPTLTAVPLTSVPR